VARRYTDTGDVEVRNQLVAHYLPLVGYVARRVAVNAPVHIDRAEFVSYGHFGLIDAVEKFELDRQVKFETYAIRRIRGAILDGLRREDPLTRSTRKKLRDAETVTDELERRLGRAPSPEEVAGELGVNPVELRTLLQSVFTLTTSFETVVSSNDDDDGVPLEHGFTDVRFDSPELSAEMREAGDVLADVLVDLPKRDRVFVGLYYCEGMSLTEIGRVLGISESRVGQIRLQVIQSLRQDR
jgi:RNA polymerase sigma factor for flagellar operon FliA